MNINFQARPSKKVGLDIGTSTVKILEISTAAKPEFSGAGLKKIAGLPRSEIPNAIKSLAAESKITSNQAAISVSGSSVIARFVSMPKMSDADLKNAISFEAEKLIPFNVKECIIDFQILDREARDKKMPVLLVAVKKEHIDEKIKTASDAGFEVTLVDVDCLAVANAFWKNYTAVSRDKVYAVLNIGVKFTNLAILRGPSICFARDITAGGENFDSSGAKAPFGGLLDEVKLSFSYYENQGGGNIDEIFVSGGFANIAGIEEGFQESFGLKPNKWNPLGCLSGVPSEIQNAAADFAVSAGLVAR